MPSLETTAFLLIGVLLVGYAILDGFDLGVGVLHLLVAKDDRERRILLNSIGPVWDGNEVWLITGGAVIFAAFPRAYATVFSGLYLAFMLLLAALIARAVSVEVRSKLIAPAWRLGWDVAFAVGSLLPALLFGVAAGNLLRGMPLDQEGEYAGTFFGLLNPFALLTGLLSTALFTLQGAAWLRLKTEGDLLGRVRRAGRIAWGVFLFLCLTATLASLWAAPHLWRHYGNPLTWIAPAVTLGAVLAIPWADRNRRSGLAFCASSLTITGLLGIMGQGLYPYLVPALGVPEAGLSITTAASSPLALRTTMVIALLGMPLVVGYTVFVYRRFQGPVVLDDDSY